MAAEEQLDANEMPPIARLLARRVRTDERLVGALQITSRSGRFVRWTTGGSLQNAEASKYRESQVLRILIIEFILAGMIGAVCFRLAWAATKKRWVAWGIVLALAILLLLFIPGGIDVGLIREFGGAFSATHPPSPVLVDLIRFLGWIVGAGLAALIVAKRKRMGLEDDIHYKDFP